MNIFLYVFKRIFLPPSLKKNIIDINKFGFIHLFFGYVQKNIEKVSGTRGTVND